MVIKVERDRTQAKSSRSLFRGTVFEGTKKEVFSILVHAIEL